MSLMDAKEVCGVNGSTVSHKSNLLDDVVREKIWILLKSPEVVKQLKKYQSRRRSQFLLRCQASRHNEKKSCHPDQDRSSESVRHASTEKPIDISCSCSAAFSVSSTLSDNVQSVIYPVIANAAGLTPVTEHDYSCGNKIWSKSDSAFTSFTSVSNSQNAT